MLTDEQLSEAIKSLVNEDLTELIQEALTRNIAVNLVIDTGHEVAYNQKELPDSSIHLKVYRHQIL